jgi:glutaminase
VVREQEGCATVVLTQERLAALVEEVRPFLKGGSVSSYLPALARARVGDVEVAVDLGGSQSIRAGDGCGRFSMQSVVKIFTLLLALHDRGESYVFERVGRDQAVGAFNSFETFERTTGIPVNPFVNGGALAVVDMLRGAGAQEKVARVLRLVRSVSGNSTIGVDEDLARSELEHSDRNRALCYYLRSSGLMSSDVEDVLWAYCQLCAIDVGVADLARAARVLSDDTWTSRDDGMPPARDVRTVRRLMLTTGMYAASGEYACAVGIPAKCGVSGATIGIVPGVGGIGIYGPSLDVEFNSVGGLRLMELLSEALGVQ